MIPWYDLDKSHTELLFNMIRRAIKILEIHLSRTTNQFDEKLLPRMLNVALNYPAFTPAVKKQILEDKVEIFFCNSYLLIKFLEDF